MSQTPEPLHERIWILSIKERNIFPVTTDLTGRYIELSKYKWKEATLFAFLKDIPAQELFNIFHETQKGILCVESKKGAVVQEVEAYLDRYDGGTGIGEMKVISGLEGYEKSS